MTALIKSTIREQIYEILKERISSGFYLPGQKLSEVAICEELGVSRSPLREAIRLLEADGLVMGEPNKGVYIKNLCEKDVRDLYQVEIMMQNASIQCGSKNINEEEKRVLQDLADEFRETYRSGDLNAYLKTSEKFHNEIVSLCDNSITKDIYQRIGFQNHRFRLMSLKDPERFQKSYTEHLEIIDALLAGDSRKAQKLMTEHLTVEYTKVWADEIRRRAIVE